jgi:hypothetical protein
VLLDESLSGVDNMVKNEERYARRALGRPSKYSLDREKVAAASGKTIFPTSLFMYGVPHVRAVCPVKRGTNLRHLTELKDASTKSYST